MAQAAIVTPALHIVASCTDRKAVPAAVRLRDIQAPSVLERFTAWRRAIRAANGSRTIAEELYQGDHWSVARTLPVVAKAMGWAPQLWVSSAGYGVVKSTTKLVPYSATFASGHVDSVDAGDADELASRQWWGCATEGRFRLGCSVSSIVDADPRATVLLLASPPYLTAMARDLATAVPLFKGRGGLFIVSSRMPAPAKSLGEYLVTSRATLQEALGGTLVSLHARAAEHLLRAVRPREFLKENIPAMSKNLEADMGGGKLRTAGSSMTDEEVIAFIRSRLDADPKVKHTRLLRELRDSQRACEQGRFRRLFRQLKPTP